MNSSVDTYFENRNAFKSELIYCILQVLRIVTQVVRE